MTTTAKARTIHNVGDVVYLPATDDAPEALGVVEEIDKKGKTITVRIDEAFRTDDDETDGLVECDPTEVKTPTPKQLKLRERMAQDEEPVVKTKQAKGSPKAKATAKKGAKKAKAVESSRNANPDYRTRECLGDEFPLEAGASLEQSVGRQALHCLTVAKQRKNPVWKSAETLFKTGALAESKIRALRDVIREHTPDADEDEQENVLAKRCCRGLGMVIARQNAEGEDDE